jgi:hypothetical protein
VCSTARRAQSDVGECLSEPRSRAGRRVERHGRWAPTSGSDTPISSTPTARGWLAQRAFDVEALLGREWRASTRRFAPARLGGSRPHNTSTSRSGYGCGCDGVGVATGQEITSPASVKHRGPCVDRTSPPVPALTVSVAPTTSAQLASATTLRVTSNRRISPAFSSIGRGNREVGSSYFEASPYVGNAEGTFGGGGAWGTRVTGRASPTKNQRVHNGAMTG